MNINSEHGTENINNSDDVLFLTPEEETHNSEHSRLNDSIKTNQNEYDDTDDTDKLSKTCHQISILADNEFEEEANSAHLKTNQEPDDTLKNGYSSPVSFDSLSTSNVIDLNISKTNDDINQTNNSSINELNFTNNEQFDQNHLDNTNIPKSIIDETIFNDFNKYLFKNTRYFLIKSNNHDNVNLAKHKSVWSTPKVNEIKLNKAYWVNLISIL